MLLDRRDGDDAEVVALGEELQVRHTGHLAVVVDDFADNGDGLEAGKRAEVDGGLGLTVAFEHATVARAEGENVSGADEVLGRGAGIGEELDRARAIGGGDAGGDAVSSFDADRERGPEGGFVLGNHRRQSEAIGRGVVHGCADEATSVHSHEVNPLRGAELRGDDDIAFVFPVFVVNDEDRATLRIELGGLWDVDDPEGAVGRHLGLLGCGSGGTGFAGLLRELIGKLDEAFDVAGENIRLNVDLLAEAPGREVGARSGEGDERDAESGGTTVDDRQADAVDADAALFDDVPQQVRRRLVRGDHGGALGVQTAQAGGAVGSAAKDVPGHPVAEASGRFEIDDTAGLEGADIGPPTHISRDGEGAKAFLRGDSWAPHHKRCTVDGQPVARARVGEKVRRVEAEQPGIVAAHFIGNDSANANDGACEEGDCVVGGRRMYGSANFGIDILDAVDDVERGSPEAIDPDLGEERTDGGETVPAEGRGFSAGAAEPNGPPGGELTSIGGTGLGQQVGDVIANRVDRDIELDRDLRVGPPKLQMGEHAPLGRGEDIFVGWTPALHKIGLHLESQGEIPCIAAPDGLACEDRSGLGRHHEVRVGPRHMGLPRPIRAETRVALVVDTACRILERSAQEPPPKASSRFLMKASQPSDSSTRRRSAARSSSRVRSKSASSLASER